VKRSNPRSPLATPTVAALAVATLILLAVAALPAAAPAQTSEGSDTDTFLDRVDVNVVNVEVFVTDGRGRRVAGLTRDDFTVTVDGQPVELTNFFAAAESAAAPASAGTADLPTGDETTVEPIEPVPRRADGGQPLFLAVYFDHVNLTQGNRKRVLDEARHLAREQAAAGNLVSLFSYNGSLEAVTPFTSNLAAVDAGFEKLSRTSTRRQVANLELARAVRGILDAQNDVQLIPSAGDQGPAPFQDTLEVERYRQARSEEAIAAYRSLDQAVGSLGGLPGRKALLYVGEGIPQSPGMELLSFVETPNNPVELESRRYDLSRFSRDVIEQANAHGVTLYTLDARGAGGNFGQSAEFEDFVALAAGPEFDQTLDLNLQAPLLDMADATGGSAILNTSNFADAFVRLEEDFGTYYSLGFASPFEGEGEYHRIEVRIPGGGYTVRHRNGFYDKSTAERIADRARSFLLQSWESNPLGIELQFGEPKKVKRRWRVPILVRVPAESVVLLPQGEQRVGKLQLMVLVQDEEGRLSDLTRMPAEIDVPAAAYEAARAEDLGYRVELEMRGGPSSLVVAVWDEVGGGESYVFQRVKVGES